MTGHVINMLFKCVSKEPKHDDSASFFSFFCLVCVCTCTQNAPLVTHYL